MTDNEFLERWTPLEASLRELEIRYRDERLRTNGKPYPEGHEVDSLLHTLVSVCELYIDATGEHRDIMRTLFGWSYLLPQYLLGIVNIPSEVLASEDITHAARVALAAASLEDNKTDCRDMFMALGSLYLTIAERGLDAETFFQESASWSSDISESGPVGQSMKRFLSNFKKSELFKSSVEPRLSRR